jgi:hypothetical protein
MTTNIEKPELVTVFFAERTGEKAGTIVVRRIRFSNVVASDSAREGKASTFSSTLLARNLRYLSPIYITDHHCSLRARL